MNREIKFRAWDKQHNCFTNFPFVLDNNGRVYREYIGGGKVEKHYIIMQFTGLLDKNGVEIYEGDVILLWENDKKGVAVLWDEEIAGFGFKGQDMATHLNFRKLSTRNYVVIGNIYENPELIKNK